MSTRGPSAENVPNRVGSGCRVIAVVGWRLPKVRWQRLDAVECATDLITLTSTFWNDTSRICGRSSVASPMLSKSRLERRSATIPIKALPVTLMMSVLSANVVQSVRPRWARRRVDT